MSDLNKIESTYLHENSYNPRNDLTPTIYSSANRELFETNTSSIIPVWFVKTSEDKSVLLAKGKPLAQEISSIKSRSVPDNISEVILLLKNSTDIPYANALANRIIAIQASIEQGDEYDCQESIHIESLFRSVEMLEYLKFKSQPSLIITFDGCTKLHWSSKNCTLEIIFELNGSVSAKISAYTHALKSVEKKIKTDDRQLKKEIDIDRDFLHEIA